MKIIDEQYKWGGLLQNRKRTDYIILHHRAGSGNVQTIHSEHLANGWSGIGYHFYVRKDGTVYRGRPIDTIGAHCQGYNNFSVGICFEGNYQTDTEMPSAQLLAGKELVAYVKSIYKGAEVKGHRDFMATACPGRSFPFDEIAKGVEGVTKELTSANDIIWELMNGKYNVEISDVGGAVRALDEAKKIESPLYWILRKLVNG